MPQGAWWTPAAPGFASGRIIRHVTFTFTCRLCRSPASAEAVLCPGCGPTTARLRCDGPAEGAPVQRCCERCGLALGEPLRTLPTGACRHCGAEDPGWLDGQGRFWSPPLEPLEGKHGRWVRADFDGHYSGRDPRGPRALMTAPHRFELSITAAQWSGMRFVDAPPSRRREDEPQEPWRQEIVRGVFVLQGAEGTEERFEGALEDFRLHDWVFTSLEQPGVTGTRLTGRLRGTAYGRLVRPIAAPERTVTSAPAPTEPAAPVAPAPAAQTAPEAHAEPPEPAVQPDPPSSPPDAAAPRHCSRCSALGIGAATLLLWLLCSLAIAIAGAAILTLQCLLHQRLVRANRSLAGGRAHLLALFVAAGSLGGSVALLGAPGGAACGSLFPGWTLLVALAFLATAWHPRCWPRSFAGALLLLVLVVTCRLDAGACAPAASSTAAGAGPAARIAAAFSGAFGNWWSRLQFDAAGDVLDDLPPLGSMLTTGGPRVSIDQALSRPERYFSCEARGGEADAPAASFSIYFGEATLFRLNDAALRPEAQRALGKLARLLRMNPRARIILTGHTDSTGDEGFNLELSAARARAVADWLVRTQRIDPARIDSRGVADREPVVAASGPARLNRRVEMRIDCRAPGSST